MRYLNVDADMGAPLLSFYPSMNTAPSSADWSALERYALSYVEDRVT